MDQNTVSVVLQAKSQFLGTLPRLDEQFLSLHLRVQTRTIPVTSRRFDRENQKYNDSRFQNDTHPEVGSLVSRSSHSVSSNPDQVHQIVRIVQNEEPYCNPGLNQESNR